MSEQVIYPDYFARFYDFIYEQIRDGVDKTFFDQQIQQANGKVLEIGVGTGRFFWEQLNKGADIYGIDISPTMLDKLKEKLPETEHFRIHEMDVTQLKLNEEFDLIIAPFRIFSHLISVESQIAALEAIYKHLSPGGRFIFDVFIPNYKLMGSGLDRKMDFEGEYEAGKIVRRLTTLENNSIEQINNITFHIEWQDDNGNWSKKDWAFKMRYFFRYELEHLIARTSFKSAKIYTDYSFETPEAEAKDFVILCEKV